MHRYNLKSFFRSRAIQSKTHITNGHFWMDKSILTKKQREMVEGLSKHSDTINNVAPTVKQAKEYFDSLDEPKQFIPDIIILSGNTNDDYDVLISEDGVALNRNYYNMFTAKGCTLYQGRSKVFPLTIFKGDKFVGVLLPLNLSEIAVYHDYKEYEAQVKAERRARRKQG